MNGQIADLLARGWVPRQHFDDEWPIGKQIVSYSCRVVRDQDDRDALYEIATLDNGDLVQGDDQGHLFWAREGTARPCGSFWAGPVSSIVLAGGGGEQGGSGEVLDPRVTRTRGKAGGATSARKKGGVVPARRPGQADDRYAAIDVAQAGPEYSTLFPGDWTGLTARTSEEYEQLEVFHPDFLGIVAANYGDPKYGTRVFDLDLEDKIDPKRWAYVQSAWSVVRMSPPRDAKPRDPKASPSDPPELDPRVTRTRPPTTGGPTRARDPEEPLAPAIAALAWQLGKGGRRDGGMGYGLMVDYTSSEVGFLSARKAGPITLGGPRGCAKHIQGTDEDGNKIRPAHLDAGFLVILSPEKDGPVAWESAPYPSSAIDLPQKVHGHICFDAASDSWRVHASCAFTLPPEEEFLEKPSTRPYPPPPVGDPGGRPRTGDPEPEEQHVVGGNNGKPQYPTSTTCLQMPNVIFQAHSTTAGEAEPKTGGSTTTGTEVGTTGDDGFESILDELDMDDTADDEVPPPKPTEVVIPTGGGWLDPAPPEAYGVPSGTKSAGPRSNTAKGPRQKTPQQLAAHAPQVAHIEAIGAGGSWAELEANAYRSASAIDHAMIAGSLAILPADVSTYELVHGIAATQSGGVQLAFPEGLSELAFGTPTPGTGGKVAGGMTLGSAGAQAAVFTTTDELGGADTEIFGVSSSGSDTKSGNHTIESGSLFAGSADGVGGALVSLAPGVSPSSYTAGDTGAAIASTGGGDVLFGDPYSEYDLELNLQGNLTLSAPNTGNPTKVTADIIDPRSLLFDGISARPAELGAATWGLWVDSDTDELKYWDGVSDTVLSGGGGGGGPTFTDDVFRIEGSVDGSKAVAFEVDGLTTATTRTLTVQDLDGTIALLDVAQDWTELQTVTISDAGVANVKEGLAVSHRTSGTPVGLFGVAIGFYLDDNANVLEPAGQIGFEWTDSTSGSEDSDFWIRNLRSAVGPGEKLRVTSEGVLVIPEHSGTPATPAANKAGLFVGTDGLLRSIDDAGAVTAYGVDLGGDGSWQTWTSPSTTWIANVTWTGFYRVIGKMFEARLDGVFTGATTAADLQITMPAGITIDTSIPAYPPQGGGGWDGTNVRGGWGIGVVDSTTIEVFYNTGVSTMARMSNTQPWTKANGHNVGFQITLPIV